jgi:hypothetical protein
MLQRALDHLVKNVLPAANDYDNAERALSVAFNAAEKDQTKCQTEANSAKRRASDAAIAIDGLADRTAQALGSTPNAVRSQVSALCAIGTNLRAGCLERICAVANAYKHDKLHDPKHPIRSDDDVLVVGAGYGIDGFGLGKFGSVEVMVHQTNGEQRKFLADVPYSIAGWIAFFNQHQAQLPSDELYVCGMCVNR